MEDSKGNKQQQRQKQVTNNSNLVTFRAPVVLKQALDDFADMNSSDGATFNKTLYLNKLVKRDLERRGYTFDGLELERNIII